MTNRGASTDPTAADMQRTREAMREAWRAIEAADYRGALTQLELAVLLVRIAASKERR